MSFWLLVVTVGLFSLFPELDLAVSGAFFDPEKGFTTRRVFAVRMLYLGWDVAARATVLLLVLYVAASFLWTSLAAGGHRRASAFLLLTLLIGPGLCVHALKNNWGRARPMTVVELGGKKQFTPALVPSDQCSRNCSFTSGHAAFGFWWLTPAFLDRRRRGVWLALGLTLGLGIGLVRIAQGGHFLSDVIFSGWIVYGTALVLRDLVLRRGLRLSRWRRAGG